MRATTVLNVVRASRVDVARALRLEEGLLRHAPESNWLVCADGAARTSIVMGVSARDGGAALVRVRDARARGVDLIRRFTGGGTVVVDADTMFVSVCMASACVGLEPSATYPRDVMRATGDVYARVFDRCGTFAVRENDYVFGDVKFGGNAQAITKGRFLHHTSFLYDYDEASMALLKQPARAPEYRLGRAHGDFLTTLRERGYAREGIFDRLCEVMRERGFETRDVGFEDAERVVEDAVRSTGTKRWDTTTVL